MVNPASPRSGAEVWSVREPARTPFSPSSGMRALGVPMIMVWAMSMLESFGRGFFPDGVHFLFNGFFQVHKHMPLALSRLVDF